MGAFSITVFLKEARRRRVFRVVALYIVGAWVVLQIADLVFPGLGIDEAAIRYVLIGAVLGFPIALFIGWRYDIVGGQVVRTAASAVAADLSIGRSDYAILAALAFVVAIITFQMGAEISETRVAETPTFAITDIDPNSVAVLPFTNVGGNPDNEYYSDGITTTILNAIARLPGLKVPARTSSFYFKDKDIDAREIGAQLGVAYLVQGSVQRAGNKLRIVAQLIEAETGYQLWSEPYDRDIGNIFAVLDEVATMVARKMQVTLPGGGGKIETVGTDNVAAFDWYLKGMEQKSKYSNTDLLLAEISFKNAMALDPDFYEARMERAFTYLAQGNYGEITSAEAIKEVEPLVDRLLEDRPDDGLALILETEVQYVRAEIQGDGFFELDKHLAELSAAVERTPNEARLYVAIADYLRDAGRPDEIGEWVERGIVVDPLNWSLHMRRGGHLLFGRGDLDGAEAAFAKAMELNPDNPSALSRIGSIHFQRKQFAQWFAFSRKGMDLGPLDAEFPGGFVSGLSWFGLIDEAHKYLQRAIWIAPDNAFVRQAELYHLLMTDHAQARDLSEDMLRDDIEDRFGTYWWAAIVFVSTMTELGEADEALQVLEELHPEVTSPGFAPKNYKQCALQYVAVLALAQSQSREETLKLLGTVVQRWDQDFPYWRRSGPKLEGRYNAWKVVPIEMARGNTRRAIELAVENLADVEEVMRFRHLYFWKEIAKEPAVKERLAELEAEAKKGGEAIWDHIVENDLQLD